MLSRGAIPPRPMHVVNLALNLVQGDNLAWQERKADSFIVTPLHCGFRKGYRRSVDYAGGISLGTAVTISGAAATPNMGYHSSLAVTFLMALFNVRLGWWLGNPAEVTAGTPLEKLRDRVWRFPFRWHLDPYRGVTYHLVSPRLSIRPLIDEALGRTTDRNEYIYLSDGGHFENLGLYEMVRRRCKTIVVSDASCDHEHSFESLANAIRKVRIDLGIPIEIISKLRFKRVSADDTESLYYCAVGKVHYDAVDNGANPGHFVYIKPVITGKESADIFNYSRMSESFPHESTTDQWFSEAQFESYRELGQFCIKQICGSAVTAPQSLAEFVKAAEIHCGVMSGQPKDRLCDGQRFGPLSFTQKNITAVPAAGGVFRLYDGNEIAYIGHDQNLSSRLKSHLDGKEGPLTKMATHFDCEVSSDPYAREDDLFVEYQAAHESPPKWNIR